MLVHIWQTVFNRTSSSLSTICAQRLSNAWTGYMIVYVNHRLLHFACLVAF
jgi:hypothetical protein